MKFSRFSISLFFAIVWLCVGISLWARGFGFLKGSSILLIAIPLFLGVMKGKFVINRSIERITSRFTSDKMAFGEAIPKSFRFLILGMVLLGMSVRFLGLPLPVRGFVSIAVGAALLEGSKTWFKKAFMFKRGDKLSLGKSHAPDKAAQAESSDKADV